ncbi:MAG TPA: lysoplasmalogenase [Anaerolineaceae bacterium]|nr:lysoplasmalogenase [Anaerolineaceae bacterium]
MTKPGVLVMLILWFTLLGKWEGSLVWFGLALVFSLGGDVFLLFSKRFFLFGLLSFFVGHVFYLIGFNQTLPPLDLGTLAILVGLGVAAVTFYRFIRRGLMRDPESAAMSIPVLAYTVILTLMAFSAIATLLRPDWPMEAAILAAVGGMLFFISDSTLATETFVRRFPYSSVIVIVTYHLAQLALTYAALLRY